MLVYWWGITKWSFNTFHSFFSNQSRPVSESNHTDLCLRGSHLISYTLLIGLPSLFPPPSVSLRFSKLHPLPTPSNAISPAQAAIAVDCSRLSPCAAAGVLMNSSRLLNEDLLKCCRLIVWHFRASGGVLNRCLCKCHSLTLWKGWPYE